MSARWKLCGARAIRELARVGISNLHNLVYFKLAEHLFKEWNPLFDARNENGVNLWVIVEEFECVDDNGLSV